MMFDKKIICLFFFLNETGVPSLRKYHFLASRATYKAYRLWFSEKTLKKNLALGKHDPLPFFPQKLNGWFLMSYYYCVYDHRCSTEH